MLSGLDQDEERRCSFDSSSSEVKKNLLKVSLLQEKRLEYSVEGNKPLIILIHGASEMSDAEIMILLCGVKRVIFFGGSMLK